MLGILLTQFSGVELILIKSFNLSLLTLPQSILPSSLLIVVMQQAKTKLMGTLVMGTKVIQEHLMLSVQTVLAWQTLWNFKIAQKIKLHSALHRDVITTLLITTTIDYWM